MGEAGCVHWMFNRRGMLLVDRAAIDEDRLMEIALDAGADDVSESGDTWEISTAPDAFEGVRVAVEREGIRVSSAEIAMVPETTIPVTGSDAQQLLRLLELLEDLDDVQSVAVNADLDPEEVSQLES